MTICADAIFEGGGVKALGMVGALYEAERRGYTWVNVAAVRKAIINSLKATMVERDHMTESHAERLTLMAEHFGKAAGLKPGEIEELKTLTLMHDIGKIGVPDRILFKPGPLTAEEREEMQKHSEMGYRIAAATVELESIALFILHHHEKWDGTGYPSGLAGENIPLLCRILSILDTYDAMINDRPYRKGMSHEAAAKELIGNASSQFDPSLVEIFFKEVYPLSLTLAV